MSRNEINQTIHDIRKPLNGISMQAELIKILVESKADSALVLAAANKIISNAKQCSNMLQTLSE